MPIIKALTFKLMRTSLIVFLLLFCTFVNAQPQKEGTKNKAKIEISKKKKDSVDQWSDWNSPTLAKPKYGVGIQGDIESKLNQLDKSNLLDNTNGVLVKKNNNKAVDKMKKPKNIKQMMAELKAMEAELKQELSHESEF